MMFSWSSVSDVDVKLVRRGAKAPRATLAPVSAKADQGLGEVGEQLGRLQRPGHSALALLSFALTFALGGILVTGGCSKGLTEPSLNQGSNSPTTGSETKVTEGDENSDSDNNPEDSPSPDNNDDTDSSSGNKGKSSTGDSDNNLPKDSNSSAPEPTCDDGIKNGRETDIDCGGNDCEACVNGDNCRKNKDCKSGYCHEDGVCKNKPARCDDGIKNGEESDVDCGGSECDPCELGKQCKLGSDCDSKFCKDGLCSKADCRSDDDCSDESYGPCQEGYCDPDTYKCRPRAKNEGQSCSSGKTCLENESCKQGECVGTQKDCSHLATPCDKAFCNEETGKCEAKSQVLWKENFAKVDSNSNGWDTNKTSTLTSWRVGAARASKDCFLGQDPAYDHSKTSDNNLIGTMIGGCVLRSTTEWDCVQSPAVDTRQADDGLTLRFWRHLHSGNASSTQHQIRMLDPRGQWIVVEEGYSQPISDRYWTELKFDLSRFKHADYKVRICMRQVNAKQSSSLAPAGWSVDDFSIAPKDCVVEQ